MVLGASYTQISGGESSIAVRWVHFIQRSKALGFSLREIKDLLSLRVDSKTTCDAVKGRADAKIADIEKKIRHLQEMKRALVTLTVACRKKKPTSECPILEALGDTILVEGGKR